MKPTRLPSRDWATESEWVAWQKYQGYSNNLGEARRRTLEHSVMDLFPGGDAFQASYWCGLRPMTPDRTPVIGPTKIAGLFLNTGHGTIGWK